MTKELSATQPTHVIAVLDRSGSMAARVGDVIGGYNTFLKKQKEIVDGSFMSLYLFDDVLDRVYHNEDLQEVPELTGKTYFARGGTALLDAVGKAIEDAGSYKKVILLVVTDGEENSSKFYTNDKIKSLIKNKEEKGWQVIYLGSSVEAFGEANKAGFSVANSVKFNQSPSGFSTAYAGVHLNTASYRGGIRKDFSSHSTQDYADLSEVFVGANASDVQTADGTSSRAA